MLEKNVHRRFIFVKISLILICPLKVDMQGLLGRVRFNNAGYNAEYNMDILSVESRNNVTTSWRVGLFPDYLTKLRSPYRLSIPNRDWFGLVIRSV